MLHKIRPTQVTQVTHQYCLGHLKQSASLLLHTPGGVPSLLHSELSGVEAVILVTSGSLRTWAKKLFFNNKSQEE